MPGIAGRLVVAAALCGLMAGCGADSGQSAHPAGLTAETRMRIGRAAETGGDTDLAAAMYGEAGQDGKSDVKLQLKAADGLIRTGKTEQAEAMLRQSLLANPGQADLLHALGLVHVASGRPEEAIRDLDQVLASKPRDVAALVDKAVALDLLLRHPEAQDIYRKALLLAPGDIEITNNLALSMMLQGRVVEAETLLAPLQDGGATPVRVKNNLGVMYAATGEPAKARDLVGTAMSEDSLLELSRAVPKAADRR